MLKSRMQNLNQKIRQTEILSKFLNKQNIEPTIINKILEKRGSTKVNQKKKLFSFLSRPHVSFTDLLVSEELTKFIEKK